MNGRVKIDRLVYRNNVYAIDGQISLSGSTEFIDISLILSAGIYSNCEYLTLFHTPLRTCQVAARIPLWAPQLKKDEDRPERIQTRAAKVVTGWRTHPTRKG